MKYKKFSAARAKCKGYYNRNRDKRSRAEIVKKFVEYGVGTTTAHNYYKDFSSDCGTRRYAWLPAKTGPKNSGKTLGGSKVKLLLLNSKLGDRQIICDDRFYFDLKGYGMSGPHGFWYFAGEANKIPDVVKNYKPADNVKIAVWAAISDRGISDVYFHESKDPMNYQVYIDECIKKRLRPFMKKHKQKEVIFWPGLGYSQYAAKTVHALEELEIPYVPKDSNPKDFPKLKPIKTFWHDLRDKVYAHGWEANDTPTLIKKIKQELRTFDTQYFKKLMENLNDKVKEAANNV